MVGLVFEVRDPSVRVARVGREFGVAHRGEPFEPIGPDPEFRSVVRSSGVFAGAGIGLTLAIHLWAMGTGIRGCKRAEVVWSVVGWIVKSQNDAGKLMVDLVVCSLCAVIEPSRLGC